MIEYNLLKIYKKGGRKRKISHEDKISKIKQNKDIRFKPKYISNYSKMKLVLKLVK